MRWVRGTGTQFPVVGPLTVETVSAGNRSLERQLLGTESQKTEKALKAQHCRLSSDGSSHEDDCL